MKSALLILAFVLISSGVFSQDLRLMFYNAENVFDTADDPLTDDGEFLPGGERRWNASRYRKKLSSLHKTITAAGDWTPPAIVAFCEVENRKVLTDLVTTTYLSKYNYSIIHEDSPDRRGIDVCLIFLDDLIQEVMHEYWIPPGIPIDEYNTRNVLYAKFGYLSDTIHLIVNHWPSRRGGVLAGEGMRISIASMIRGKADSIIALTGKKARIIITGDFNCTPGDPEIKRIMQPGGFVNLSEGELNGGPGTYRYQGTWETFDQMIVSESLIGEGQGIKIKPGSFRIFKPGFLVFSDPLYPGQSPFSTYRGYRYQGGFSDHLPILVDLRLVPEQE